MQTTNKKTTVHTHTIPTQVWKMSSTNFINISHINISSIIQKTKQIILNDYLINNNIHILSINETHLKQHHNFELTGYKIYRKDRICKKKGGVALAVSIKLKSEELKRSGKSRTITD